jgi:Spy/CpxP family protein refolding chaperone
MTTRTKTLASLLTGAVALSSGAYALGSQAGGGNADAAGTSASSGASAGDSTMIVSRKGPDGPGLDRDGEFGLSTLAGRLGVSEAALRDALEAIGAGKTPDQHRAELAQALATTLNKPVADVQSALDAAMPKPDVKKVDLSAAIAKELGVDTAKVQAGLDTLHQKFRDRSVPAPDGAGDPRDAIVDAIASSTGADPAKVRAALDKVHQSFGGRHVERFDIRQKLADALKVTPAQIDAAFQKVKTDEMDQLASALAQRLNIDVAKVQSALQDVPRIGFGLKRHG